MQAVQYPLAFGHWQLRGNTLVCRLPRRTVIAHAPAPLLAAVLALCDGRLGWKQVAAELGARWSPGAVKGFLARLSREGALVESAHALAGWTELGQAPGLFPRLASDAELPSLALQVRQRLLPGAGPQPQGLTAAARAFAELLHRRVSRRTFGATPLSADTLRAILWAAHGVTQAAVEPGPTPHRTVASGGDMHAVRWFLAALQHLPGDDAPGIAPGLHEVRFHHDGGVHLQPLQGHPHAPWRLLSDPRVLQFASALLLPVADLRRPARKYGNRAALFAQLEAGESLQNAQLMATALEAACVMRGDTLASEVMRALALPAGAWIALPALVLGSTPSPQQVHAQRSEGWVRLQPAASASAPAFSFTAGPVPLGQGSVFTLGRSDDPRLALAKAEAEAWERWAWACPRLLVEGTARGLGTAADVPQLIAYTAHQHARPGFPFRRFHSGQRRLWCAGVRAADGASVHVPAECVHALDALPPAAQRNALTLSSTSGVAAWTDAEGALERACLELVERDAFLRCWVGARPAPHITPATLPASARRRVQALEQAGHRVAVLAPPSVLAPVLAVFVQSLQRPFTAVTAAAAFDIEAALHKALDEAEGRAAHAHHMPARPLRGARSVLTPHDVNRYYQTPRFFRRADFLAQHAPGQAFGAPAVAACDSWPALKARLGQHLLAVDITPPGASIHQGRTPLHVVRAFVPGLLPLWFRQGLEPAGLAAFRAARGGAPQRRSPIAIHPFT